MPRSLAPVEMAALRVEMAAGVELAALRVELEVMAVSGVGELASAMEVVVMAAALAEVA